MNRPLLAFLIFLCTMLPMAAKAQEPFQELKGDHFILYYRCDKPYAETVLSAAEKYYHSIAERLGYERFDNFWTWDNRVKIYLFAGRTEYLANSNRPGWSEGYANFKKRTIAGYDVAGFVDTVLPHEITHLILRDIVGPQKNVPLWLDEGIALAFETRRHVSLFNLLRTAVQKNAFLPLDFVMGVRSPRWLRAEFVMVFYAEATVIVYFLTETYGREKFAEFCRGLRSGHGAAESLRRTYGTEGISNAEDLQKKVLKFVKEKT